MKANTKNEEWNFVQQLQNQGLIDHLVVSFYIDSECRNKSNFCSHIKFGSYDQVSIKAGEELTMIRTDHWGTWDLNVNKLTIGNLNKKLAQDENHVKLSPELPYLYLPSSLYEVFIDRVNLLYDGTQWKPICDKEMNRCRFGMHCVVVEKKGIGLKFNLYDTNLEHEYVIP